MKNTTKTQHGFTPWTFDAQNVRELSTWEFKKIMSNVENQRPTFTQQLHAYFFEFVEESFAGRATILFAALAMLYASLSWALPFSGLAEDAWVVAITAIIVAAVTFAWDFSRFVTRWDSELPVPRHYKPRG